MRRGVFSVRIGKGGKNIEEGEGTERNSSVLPLCCMTLDGHRSYLDLRTDPAGETESELECLGPSASTVRLLLALRGTVTRVFLAPFAGRHGTSIGFIDAELSAAPRDRTPRTLVRHGRRQRYCR